ncbi:Subtilase family protein [Planctomycetes bacterium MalM25]|nr:Subtilase family protein [Planctomycetes bacterium MalM25]
MPQDEISAHAVQVAGVLKSTDANATGVATGIDLYSIGGSNATAMREKAFVLAAQELIYQPEFVRAINMSFALGLGGGNTLDGNSLLTQFVDWSAREHDLLYVAAGNQLTTGGQPDGLSIPTDNYNGITVSRSIQRNGIYSEASAGNDFGAGVDAVGTRTSVDILAPGDSVLMPTLNPTQQPQGTISTVASNGTSFAAPHATGAVALLQEYAVDRINTPNLPNWDTDARRHEVMKAVIMNSADKILDTGDGLRLGMGRNVYKKSGTNQTFLNSNAFTNPAQPLDEEIGVGHLDVARALRQFEGGETETVKPPGPFGPFPPTIVPQVGWDYANTSETGASWNVYEFTDPLQRTHSWGLAS